MWLTSVLLLRTINLDDLCTSQKCRPLFKYSKQKNMAVALKKNCYLNSIVCMVVNVSEGDF